MAGAVGAKLGRAIEFQSATSADAAGNVIDAVEFRLEIEGVPHAIALVPNRSFVKLLNAAKSSASAAKSVSREVETIKPSAVSGVADVPENLALLMDVELDLAVSFGSTVMPLEEVIQLGPGAIVELNRGASDPVDLLINNSVIARGEVVVVDGNYGVRITHIVSTSERIAKVL
jgi:flagellar motor switch protein FliN/FliY